MYYRWKKFVTQIFVIFYRYAELYFLNLFFPGRCSKVLNLLQPLGLSNERNIFQRFEKSYFYISKERLTKNAQQIEKWHELPRITVWVQFLPQKFFYWAFYHTMLTLLVDISVVDIFVSHWSPAARFRKKRYSYYM